MNSTGYDCGPLLEYLEASTSVLYTGIGLKIYLAFMIFLIIATTCGNSLVIYSVIKVRALHKRQNIYVVSLAFADMIMALIVMTLNEYEIWNGYWDLPWWLCDIRNIIESSSSSISIYNLTAIAVDRFLAICYPFIYVKVSRIMTSCIVASAWIIPLIFWTAYFLDGWNAIPGKPGIKFCLQIVNICAYEQNSISVYVTVFLIVLGPAIAMYIMYFKMYTTAKKHVCAIQALNVTEESRKKNRYFTGNTKAARTLGIVIVCFFICWVPVVTVTLIDDLTQSKYVSVDLIRILAWLAYMNSMMNPILYYVYSQEFKMAFKTVIFCKNNGVADMSSRG